MSKQMVTQGNQIPAEAMNERPTIAPAVDVYENADEFLLIADVPGVTKDRVSIHLDDGKLTLLARRNGDERDHVSTEYKTFDWKRTFTLPEGLDHGKSAAELRDGVLFIRVPKSARMKPRRIEVRSA